MMDAKASREFSDKSRGKMADAGVAMPDGSYPIPDKDALGRAIQSFGRAKDPAATKRHIIKRARALGATSMLPKDWSVGKASELKAEPLDTGQLDRWLAGRKPRRILVAPFGGKLKASMFGYPDDEYGRDLDGEYFHPGTDFFGPNPRMKANRDRLVDWHHVTFMGQKDPAPGASMKGAVLGRMVLDEAAESDGMWADWWANAGEQRRALVALLERRHVPLYNSTQPIQGQIAYGKAGAIDVWPIRFDTITTAPQNELAAVPPLKAILADPSFSDFSGTALAAALAESDDLDAYLAGTSKGDLSAKAGRVLSSKTRAQLYELARQLSEFVRRYDPSAPPIEVPDDE